MGRKEQERKVSATFEKYSKGALSGHFLHWFVKNVNFQLALPAVEEMQFCCFVLFLKDFKYFCQAYSSGNQGKRFPDWSG